MSDSPKEDVLSEFLTKLNVSAKVFGLPSVCGEWQINTTGVSPAQFHLVSRGSCYLHMRHLDAPMALRAGDMTVVMHGDWHVLSANIELDSDEGRYPSEGKGPFTSLVCGQFEFSERARKLLASLLPPLIVIHPADAGDQFATVMRLLADEGQRKLQGSEVVMDKLSDALFVMLLRHYLLTVEKPQGILAGLADEKLSKAISSIHRNPGLEWTLPMLSDVAGMSRTAFTEKFSQLVGQAPVAYLTEYRMQEAERLMADPKNSIKKIAQDMGYATEASFRKAFKRITGVNTGDARRK
jgi:AraC family transcriptional regulator, activator of mtrCDE